MPCSVQSLRLPCASLLLASVALLGIGGCGEREQPAERTQAAAPAEQDDRTSNSAELPGEARVENESEPEAAARAESAPGMDKDRQTEKPVPEEEVSAAKAPPRLPEIWVLS